MAEQTFKIKFTDTGLVKSIRLSKEMTVGEAIEQIYTRVEGLPPGREYILFLPTQRRVMLADKPLSVYQIDATTALEARPKTAHMKVKLVDNTLKTMAIEVGALVSEVTNFVGGKLNLKITEEFGLQLEDTGDWLEPTVPLLEQVNEGQILCLRKKFFLSDKNLDKDDPIQLHLVYVECMTGITTGSLPCTNDEATVLAALQMQIEKGNLNPDAPPPKGEDLHKFLPPQYWKSGLDRHVLAEWKRLINTSDMNGKYRYVQIVRGLKTYGITVFKVQEKVPGQRKLAHRLLGITRSSVVRMELDKTILQDWPLKQIKRWAAGEGVFTLDFGNHLNEYYMVFTKEGERMSKLLSGYIDLLLKKQRDTGAVIPDEEVSVATAEDIQSAIAAKVVATVGKNNLAKAATSQGHMVTLSDVRMLAESQSVQFGSMTTAEAPALDAKMDAPRFIADISAGVKMNLDDILSGDRARYGQSLAETQQLMAQLLPAYRAAAASGIGAGVHNAATNEENLLTACKAVNDSIAKLLGSEAAINASAGRGIAEIDRFDPLLYSARSALTALASQAKATMVNPVEMQKLLFELAHNVQTAIKEMCTNAEMVHVKDEVKVTAAEKRLAMLGDHTVQLMKLLAPTASEAQAQMMIDDIANAVKGAVAQLHDTVRANSVNPTTEDEPYLNRLFASSQAVSNAIDQLLHMTQVKGIESNEKALKLYDAAQSMITPLGVLLDPEAEVAQHSEALKVVKEGLANLVLVSKSITSNDPSKKEGVISAAKRLVEALKLLEQSLHSEDQQGLDEINNAIDTVRITVSEMVRQAGYDDLAHGLKISLISSAAKSSMANVLALRHHAVHAIHSIKSEPEREALLNSCQTVVGSLGEFLNALAAPLEEQEAKLPNSVINFIPEAYNLVSDSLSCLPMVTDKKQKQILAASAAAAAESLRQLNLVNKAYQPHGLVALGEELAPVLTDVVKLQAELQGLTETVKNTNAEAMALNSEQIRSTAFKTMNAAGRAIGSSITRMGEMPLDEIPIEADSVLKAVKRVVAAIKGIAATTQDVHAQQALISDGYEFLNAVMTVVQAISADPKNIGNSRDIVEAALAKLVDTSKGIIISEVEAGQAKAVRQVEDVAERELLGAADLINAALKRLVSASQQAKTKATAKGLTLDEAGISEELLEASRSLVLNTGELIRTTTEAERVVKGSTTAGVRVDKNMYHADPKWEQGLISAAKAVAGSVQFLVKASNDHIRGEASEFAIIAAAKTVAANSAQLQISTKVKLSATSKELTSVAAASQAVNGASALLVKAANAHASKNNTELDDEETKEIQAETSNASETQLKILQMEAQMLIKTLEKEIQDAHFELAKLRKERYEEAYKKYMERLGVNVPKPAVKPAAAKPPTTTTAAAPRPAAGRAVPPPAVGRAVPPPAGVVRPPSMVAPPPPMGGAPHIAPPPVARPPSMVAPPPLARGNTGQLTRMAPPTGATRISPPPPPPR